VHENRIEQLDLERLARSPPLTLLLTNTG
jgi:hypothetical protein